MRWRLYIFFLSATAAFCFMLLTAVTDHNANDGYQPSMVSAARTGMSSLASLIVNTPPGEFSAVEKPVEAKRFDPSLRPELPAIFVAHDSDPVLARREEEMNARSKRLKTPPQRRLTLDGDGWFREEMALVTAYCPCTKCCGRHSPGITSIGKNAWTPGLAADPAYLEYGTRVYVPGYGMSTIDDTGGAMRRHWRRDGFLHIDVRMTYHYEARQWGKQYIKVKIYDED